MAAVRTRAMNMLIIKKTTKKSATSRLTRDIFAGALPAEKEVRARLRGSEPPEGAVFDPLGVVSAVFDSPGVVFDDVGTVEGCHPNLPLSFIFSFLPPFTRPAGETFFFLIHDAEFSAVFEPAAARKKYH